MNIVITGASSGIGFHTALMLSANTDDTVIAVSRNAAKLDILKAESLKRNPESNLQVITADIANEAEAIKLGEALKSKIKQIHVLINNAGLLINKPFEQLSLTEWTAVYSTNVFGAVLMIQQLLPLLTAASKEGNGKAHVVNISSMGGFQGSAKFKGLSAYSSSKAALVGITECLAEEFKDKNISVNCLCLGAVQTEMFSLAFPSLKASSSVEQMAAYIAHFALEGQRVFNGKIIPVADSTP